MDNILFNEILTNAKKHYDVQLTTTNEEWTIRLYEKNSNILMLSSSDNDINNISKWLMSYLDANKKYIS